MSTDPIIKPLMVYFGAVITLLTNYIANIHAGVSLLVVTATLIFIVYQIVEKHRKLFGGSK